MSIVKNSNMEETSADSQNHRDLRRVLMTICGIGNSHRV